MLTDFTGLGISRAFTCVHVRLGCDHEHVFVCCGYGIEHCISIQRAVSSLSEQPLALQEGLRYTEL